MKHFVVNSHFAAEMFEAGLYSRFMEAVESSPSDLVGFTIDNAPGGYALVKKDGTIFYLGATVRDALTKLENWKE